MTGPIITPVTLRSATSPDTRPSMACRTLPLAPVPTPRSHTIVYGIATIDPSGRVADRHILNVLRWASGTRLDIHEDRGVVVLQADPRGVFGISGQGHLRLPAAVRHRCALNTGDRVLLAAWPEQGTLFLHPPTHLDDVLVPVHTSLIGGDPQ
ncbi:AbrB/MazE/SpoVT family DNA-binding domain-containing protein [Kibdelosporangium lantanae]|uniref:AbrB/MazE/SpoVT family DNA-binding domain-containing protein n=1 Tax=Kibdelosporangium lantanae TaxID=1497396 RepID=A0ABW3M7X6_9PSEU